MVAVDFMIAQSDGANLSRANLHLRACTLASLVGKGVYKL